jgi:hypothetical protein
MNAVHEEGRVVASVVRALRYCARPVHLRRTVTIALIVGTWVTLLNQGDALLGEGPSAGLAVRAVLNYLTPFVVSNLGLLSNAPLLDGPARDGPGRDDAARGEGHAPAHSLPYEEGSGEPNRP